MNRIVHKINKVSGKLASIDRYSQTRLMNPESVLEHTGFVCFCALMVGKELEKAGEVIDFAELLIKATVHDLEEIVTGDIACPTKYWDDRITREIKRVEAEAGKKVLNDLDPSGELYTFWEASKHNKEGFIVALADKLAVVYKVNQETMEFGNQTIKGHIDGLIPALMEMDEYIHGCGLIDNHKVIGEIITEAIEICRATI